jgi:hypothetical protein
MKGALWKGCIGMFFIISLPQWVMAKEGKPLCNITFNHVANLMQSDTLPPPKNSAAGTNGKPAVAIIKVVPKARRQPVPIPVIVKVKPVKIVKPIIKPLIRILH